MTGASAIDVYYDPFDFEIDDNPYPSWKRLRDEAPLYYNEKYSFYALSRYEDVAHESAQLGDLPVGQRNDPRHHLSTESRFPRASSCSRIHRFTICIGELLSRVFTPRRMEAIEPLARAILRVRARSVDRLARLRLHRGPRRMGARCEPSATSSASPSRTRQAIRKNTDGTSRTEGRQAARAVPPDLFEQSYQVLADYIDWRAEHPSDDLMTQLLNAEVEDADGTRRQLTRSEVLNYTGTIAGAGNETTTRLIGFIGQLLSDHPDQRRQIVADPSLIPGAIEEALRYEAPSPVQARYVARDAECYGQTVPEGSVMLLLNGSANRDERHFADPDRFDIHRNRAHLSFGQGLHFCLGSALARMEARVALEEVLKRWPDWQVDYANAAMAHTASVRGWARLPVRLG